MASHFTRRGFLRALRTARPCRAAVLRDGNKDLSHPQRPEHLLLRTSGVSEQLNLLL